MFVGTLITRRFGSAIGGLFTAMPLLAGPISYFNCIEQGTEFAINSAHSCMLGYASIGLCVFPFLFAAKRGGWFPALIVGSIAYFLAAYVIRLIEGSIELGFLFSISIIILVQCSLPHTTMLPPKYIPRWWDLPLRMAISVAITLGVTETAEILGPQWSGFISTYPSISFLMATFTLAQCGYKSAIFYWQGMLFGLLGSVLFFYSLSYALVFCPVWLSYCIALIVNIIANACILWIGYILFKKFDILYRLTSGNYQQKNR